MISRWEELRALALGLNLPQVTVEYAWGQETLKAPGKTWTHSARPQRTWQEMAPKRWLKVWKADG